MTEGNANLQSAGTRFPFINLEKALGRAKGLFEADQKGREMPISGAFGVWDYSAKSSGGFQTIAALKHYGLLKDSSGGDGRKIVLTDSALRYFRDEREEEQKKLQREFALRPKLISALWKEWGPTPPADTVARSHLKAERGLNDQGARSLLAIYKENLAFADLKAGDKVAGNQPAEEPEMVQEESAFHMPIEPALPGMRHPLGDATPVPQGSRRAVFTLPDGDVALVFPETLLPESVDDLETYIGVWLKRLRAEAAKRDKDGGATN